MPKRKMRVYIAGPMTGGSRGFFNMKKIHEAIEAYFTLIEWGFVPHCPHLTVFCEFMKPDKVSYEEWLELDRSYIDDCDVVLRIEGHSPGADKECAYARSQGKPTIMGLSKFAFIYKPLKVLEIGE